MQPNVAHQKGVDVQSKAAAHQWRPVSADMMLNVWRGIWPQVTNTRLSSGWCPLLCSVPFLLLFPVFGVSESSRSKRIVSQRICRSLKNFRPRVIIKQRSLCALQSYHCDMRWH